MANETIMRYQVADYLGIPASDDPTGWEAMSTDAEGSMQAAATSKIRERAVRGSIRIKKVPVETEKAEARYRFWGLPTGVNMLPKFAPIVCKTMVEINSFCCPVIVRIIMPKGTNVSSDTSLVMNMLEKKHSRESTSINCRVVRTFVSSAEPRK